MTSRCPAAAIARAAAGQFVRLLRWQGWRCGSNPILIVLHIGYLWLPAGLLLLGFAQLALVPESAALHALSTGAMATMILAVMSRASLGHTGRPLVAGPVVAASYLLVTVAALSRIAAGFGSGEQHAALAVAGAAWSGAFGLFLLRFVPILCSARNDDAGENRS